MAEEGRGRKPFFHTPVCGRGQQQNSSGLGRTSQQHQFHWKWKTEPCRYFQRGYCYKGPTCTFIHEGEDEWPGFLFASPFLRLADVQPQRNSHGRRDTRNDLERFQSGPGQNEATNPGGAGFSEPLLCPYFLHEGKCADGENCPFAHDLIRRNFYKGSYMSTRNSYTRQQEDMYIDSAARHAGSHSERTASYNSGHMRSDSYPEQTGLYSEHMYTDLDQENSASFRAWTKPIHEEDERPSRQVTRQPEDTVTESSARHTGSHPERTASYSGDMRSDSFSVQNGSYSELTNLNPENIASSSGSRALAPPTPEGETKEVHRYFQQGRCRKEFEEDCGFLHEGGQGSEGHKGEQLVSPKLSFGHKGIEGLGGTSSPRNLEEHKVEFLLPNLDDEAIHILMKRRMERDPRSVCKDLHSTFFSEPPLPPPLKLRTLWIGQEVIHIPVLNYDEIMMKRGERQRQALKLVESTVMPGAQDRQEELEEVDGPSEVP